MKPCYRGHLGERYASGGCKECAKERHQNSYVPRPRGGSKARLPDGRRRVDIIEWRMLWGAKNRAEKRGLPFNLEIEDIVIPDICPVLGIPMERPELDRKINSDGYVKGNVVVISGRANRIKSDALPEELEAILRYMRSS